MSIVVSPIQQNHHNLFPTAVQADPGAHHCREVPRKDDTTATFSLRLERAKWAENQVRLMYGILKKVEKGRRVSSQGPDWKASAASMQWRLPG